MKKLLVGAFALSAISFAAPPADARPLAAEVTTGEPQVRVQIGPQRNRRWRNRGARTYTTTRIVRIGRYRYRETIRVRHLPNGRVHTQVISRQRIR